MTTADALGVVKPWLDIDSADFDAMLASFIEDAPLRLAPKAMQDSGVYTLPCTVDINGQATIALTTDSFRQIEAVYSDGSARKITNTYQYGNNVRLRELSSDVKSVLVYGLKKYTLATVPTELNRCVYYFAMADFHTFLATRAKKAGQAEKADSYDSTASMFEAKAEAIIEEKSIIYAR